MKLKYSLGFLIASLVQMGIIIFTESFNISLLGARLTLIQVLNLILLGQFFGYFFLFVLRLIANTESINYLTNGIILGVIVWTIVLPFASFAGQIRAYPQHEITTIITSLSAFLAYGIITSYTIRKYDHHEIRI